MSENYAPVSLPPFPAGGTYLHSVGAYRPWVIGGWQKETMSWKTGCYIHDGLSIPMGQTVFEGPDVLEFWSSIAVNSFAKFPINSAKHAVMCTKDGLIASHGIVHRNADDAIQLYVAGIWANYLQTRTKLRVTTRRVHHFLFQIAGPTCLQTLERVTGESLRDVGFLRSRKVQVRGKSLTLLRIGMAGTLAYELHGPSEYASEIYDAVVDAGQEFGIERLGWNSYFVNHVEGGFPQSVWTFHSASETDPDPF